MSAIDQRIGLKPVVDQKDTTPNTPKITDQHSPSLSRISIKRSPSALSGFDYTDRVKKWISLFKKLNHAIQNLYEMCNTEGLQAFTLGTADWLEHLVAQFKGLSENQESGIDIRDNECSIDGELLRQLMDEHSLTPDQALVILVRSRAQEETTEDGGSETDESNEEFYLSYESDSRSRSVTPGRRSQRNFSRLKNKPRRVDLKSLLDHRMERASLNKSMIENQIVEEARKKSVRIQELKESREQWDEQKRKEIELSITFKQARAEESYAEHLNAIRSRAKNENQKLSEVQFINQLQAAEKKMQLENKIDDTRERRAKMLENVKAKQTGASLKAEAAKERRLEQEAEAQNKLISQQQKLEDAELRRNKLLEEKKKKISEDKIKAEQKRKLHRDIKNSPQKDAESENSDYEWEFESSDEDSGDKTTRKRSNTVNSDAIRESNKYKTCYAFNKKNIRNKYIGTKQRFAKIAKEKKLKLRWCPHCNFVLPIDMANEEHFNDPKHKNNAGNSTNLVFFYDQAELVVYRETYLRKRAKKVKQLLAAKAIKHESACIIGREASGPNKKHLQKLSNDLEKCILASQMIDYPQLESIVKDTIKFLEQRREADLHMMRQLKFIPCVMEVVKKLWSCPKHEVRSIMMSLEIITKLLCIFAGLAENRTYLMVTNRLITIADLVHYFLSKPVKTAASIIYLPQLFHLLTIHLKHRLPPENKNLRDVYIEYLLCCGVIYKLKAKLKFIRGPEYLTNNTISLILLKSVSFLEALTSVHRSEYKPAFENNYRLGEYALCVFKETEMVGIAYLLANILLAQGIPKQQVAPKSIPQSILGLSIISIRFLNNLSRLHLSILQETLGLEDYRNQMYCLFNYLLLYCIEYLESGLEDIRELLHELILLIGYFSMLMLPNQNIMNQGETCILQRLTNLPIAYFNDVKYVNVLFPSLISICYEHNLNTKIVNQELDISQIYKYIEKQMAIYREDEDPPEEEEKKDSHSRAQKSSCSISSSGSSAKSMLAAASANLVFPNRFPRQLWEKAVSYFKEQEEKLV